MGCSSSAVQTDSTGTISSKTVDNNANSIDRSNTPTHAKGDRTTGFERGTTTNEESFMLPNSKTKDQNDGGSCVENGKKDNGNPQTEQTDFENIKTRSSQDQVNLTVSDCLNGHHVVSIPAGSASGSSEGVVTDSKLNEQTHIESSPPCHDEPQPNSEIAPEQKEKQDVIDHHNVQTASQQDIISSRTTTNDSSGLTHNVQSTDQSVASVEKELEAPRDDSKLETKQLHPSQEYATDDSHHQSQESVDENPGKPQIINNPDPPATAHKEVTTAGSDELPKLSSDEGIRHHQSKDHQMRFSQGLRSFCRLVDPEELLRLATPQVSSLTLERAPAGSSRFPFRKMLSKLTGVTELNLSGNNLGPQAFRVIALAMCHNKTIKSLDISNNQADTDSSECLGQMLSLNHTLASLNVSSNQLGKDFFSRCVGPSLATNNTLSTLRASSCELADLGVLLDNLIHNTSLKELDIGHNQMNDSESFVTKLTKVLKSPNSQLRVLHMRNCNIRNEGMDLLIEALRENSTLEQLHAGGNMMSCPATVFSLILTCIRHPTMAACNINDTGVISQEPAIPEAGNHNESMTGSTLTSLSIANCSLTDDIITALANQHPGSLPNLSDLDLTGNTALTAEGVGVFSRITSSASDDDALISRVHILKVGSLSAGGLPSVLQGNSCSSWTTSLRSLDLRRAKMSPQEVGGLAGLCRKPAGLCDLCLDGLKLSGSDALGKILSTGSSCSIKSLSLASCALQDDDIPPITAAVTEGWAVCSLKLSANRITDTGAVSLMESFVSRGDECTLVDLNLANNRLSDGCADTVSTLVRLAPRLHSLLLGHNALGGTSLKTILTSLRLESSSSGLTVLDLSSQEAQVDETDMEEILTLVADKLGFRMSQQDDGTNQFGSSPLPPHRQGLTINLTGLGGSSETGQAFDSLTVKTDYARVQRPWLSLQHTLELSDWLKGMLTSEAFDESDALCSLTSAEWHQVLGLPKDPSVPSWLQISDHRLRAVYLTGLSGGVSAGKLEGDLESEADCSVDEICIMKDFILRRPNGMAWVLLADDVSVQKALSFCSEGKALMFSQPYTISNVRLSIITDDGSSAEDVEKARRDLTARAEDAARENAEHRALLASSYQASQERHEYAKANPAYADGRIW